MSTSKIGCLAVILASVAVTALAAAAQTNETAPGSSLNDALGVYSGPFGTNTITLRIENIHGKTASGHSEVGKNRRSFSGSVTERGGTPHFEVREPGDNPEDGLFRFQFLPERQALVGTWSANNKQLAEIGFTLAKQARAGADRGSTTTRDAQSGPASERRISGAGPSPDASAADAQNQASEAVTIKVQRVEEKPIAGDGPRRFVEIAMTATVFRVKRSATKLKPGDIVEIRYGRRISPPPTPSDWTHPKFSADRILPAFIQQVQGQNYYEPDAGRWSFEEQVTAGPLKGGKRYFKLMNGEESGRLTALWVLEKLRDPKDEGKLDIGGDLAPGQSVTVEFDTKRFGNKCERTFNASYPTSETQGFTFNVCGGEVLVP